ncbi:unnamed protein product [Timema podura]|uniref:Kazal-like domain-containing protein n=1 Tax=Timema podura TaxID=61482 RepID=A0ABN7PA55_TIMPD|nr:unnamed protein product [Timema podura]
MGRPSPGALRLESLTGNCVSDTLDNVTTNGWFVHGLDSATTTAALVCVTSAMAAIRVGGVSSSSSSDPCPCPQCIINKPICAAEFSSHSRRIFSSECDMRCYNKCYDRNYFKQSYGLKC